MSSATFKELEETRLDFLKGLKPLTPIEEAEAAVQSEDDGNTVSALGNLPQPPTEASVQLIKEHIAESRSSVDSAVSKLENPTKMPKTLDWDLTLYHLFIAWVVNFGLEPEVQKAQEAALKGDTKGAAKHIELSQELIHQAAKALDLEWVPLVDLALVAFNPKAKYPASGPFGGVFLKRGDKPFMILAFKGTTFEMEVITDVKVSAVKPRDDILYGARVHAGMYQGLFEKFPDMEKDAFDIIWDGLHKLAKDLQNKEGDKVPLTVTGHSLGAGYADLMYIELVRRLAAGHAVPTSPFALGDLWTYGGPRVCLNDLAAFVRDLFAKTGNQLYRVTYYRDVVPTIPNLILVPDIGLTTYKHFDGGYRLTPDGKSPFYNKRLSEIGGPIFNDLVAKLEFHWPTMYYAGIKKVQG